MDLIIPTYGRAREQKTLAQLTATGLTIHLVVQARESLEYVKYASPQVQLHTLPDHIRTIAPTRQWILENVGLAPTICMLDDDLVFFKRRTDDPTKLRDIYHEELKQAFEEMEDALNFYAHVGFTAREGANRDTTQYRDNTRIMRVLGYHRALLLEEGIRFDTVEVMEDFHVALQLLRRGLANRVLNLYAHNQGGSGSSGGCSHFRTPELHAANARKLAALHPKFVKVVEKTTKGAWGGGTRTDVLIQWKRAYDSYRPS